jgi:epoxyqueuosine reductase
MDGIPTLKASLREKALKLGFDDIGYCSAAPFGEWHANAYESLRNRLVRDPATLMSGTRSIVVAVRRYAVYGRWPEGSAEVANYYIQSQAGYESIQPLAETLRQAGYSAAADPPIPEKQAALRAFQGFQGMNTQFCHPAFGALVNLQTILTDAPLADADNPRTECAHCGACAAACPSGAIYDGGFDHGKCIRFHMLRNVPVPLWARDLMGLRLLGCTQCQHACPHAELKEAEVPRELAWACDIAGLLRGDGGRYAKLAEYIGANYARKRRIQAQAAICAGNSGNQAYVPLLIPLLKDDNVVLRSHAAWALGKLGGIEAENALKAAFLNETDEEVKKEISDAVKGISA